MSDYLDGERAPGLVGHVEGAPADPSDVPAPDAALVGVHDHLGRLRDPESVIPAETVRRLTGRRS